MEDGLAREGVLTRCNQDRDATLDEVECANARRAAAAVVLARDAERTAELERESERKLLALRQGSERAALAEREATAAMRAAAEAAYEAQWKDPSGRQSAARAASAPSPAPAFGAPIGPVLPSIAESSFVDVYAEGTKPLGRPSLEVVAAEPPANDVPIAAPAVEIAELAVIPRPFRNTDGAAGAL